MDTDAGMSDAPANTSATAAGATLRCRWCRRPFVRRPGPGRPQEFCKRSCRQRDYESRQRGSAHGLDEADLILARATVDKLRDDIYVLQCAVEDVDRDLVASETPAEVRTALQWILDAARPLVRSAMGLDRG
jgi:hypothetical protein